MGIAGKLARQVEYRFMELYPARVCSSGGALAFDVEEETLGFWVHSSSTIENTRLIILDLYDLLYDLYNHNEEIRPYLHDYPFGPDNVCLSIYPVDEKGREIKNGKDVWRAGTWGRTILYSTKTPGAVPSVDIHEETIEEARAIIVARAAVGDLPW